MYNLELSSNVDAQKQAKISAHKLENGEQTETGQGRRQVCKSGGAWMLL